MNCCDASGRCTNGSNCATRNPAPLRFAPGVIYHSPRPAFGTAQQRRELRRVLLGWAIRLVFAVALCATARAPGAACGPDAHHMDMAAWQQSFRSAALRTA